MGEGSCWGSRCVGLGLYRAKTYFVDDLRSRAGVQSILDVAAADAPRDHHDIVSLAVLVRHYLCSGDHTVCG